MVRNLISKEIEKRRNINTGISTINHRKRDTSIKVSTRQIILVVFMLLTLMMGGISYVWSSFEGIQIGYDLSRLKQREMELQEQNAKLKLELATLKSPQYLEEAVKGEGLNPPKPFQIVVLE